MRSVSPCLRTVVLQRAGVPPLLAPACPDVLNRDAFYGVSFVVKLSTTDLPAEVLQL